MENVVRNRLQTVQFGEAQSFKNIAIVPLIAPADGKFQYRTLGEALASWDVAISEVSTAGSVPELMVVNRGSNPVLLIDGEELPQVHSRQHPHRGDLVLHVVGVECASPRRFWSC
jgi:hypothetical protein